MQGTAKKKVEGSEVGITARVNTTQTYIRSIPNCVNPTAGEEQVIAYIAGDMIEQEYQDFIAHVSECRYCLKEVVLWRAAQVLAEADNQGSASSSHRPQKVQPPASSGARQSTVIFEQQGRGTVRSRCSLCWQAVLPLRSTGQERWNPLGGTSQTRLLPM
jgi:hypothetical protein